MKTSTLTTTALMTAVLCILAPMSIPTGIVPITFSNLVIYLSLYILGWKAGTVSFLVYLLLGAVGLPVFSSFSGGIGKLIGPTGGYLIGFLPMALVSGLGISKSTRLSVHILAMTVGTAICHVMGTAWLCYVTGMPVADATTLYVIPYIPVDFAKIIIATQLGPVLAKRLASVMRESGAPIPTE